MVQNIIFPELPSIGKIDLPLLACILYLFFRNSQLFFLQIAEVSGCHPHEMAGRRKFGSGCGFGGIG